MALPQLTPEQRAAALEKAAQARKARAELKEKLKKGETDLQAVLKKADEDEILGKMKVSALLEAYRHCVGVDPKIPLRRGRRISSIIDGATHDRQRIEPRHQLGIHR